MIKNENSFSSFPTLQNSNELNNNEISVNTIKEKKIFIHIDTKLRIKRKIMAAWEHL